MVGVYSTDWEVVFCNVRTLVFLRYARRSYPRVRVPAGARRLCFAVCTLHRGALTKEERAIRSAVIILILPCRTNTVSGILDITT